MARKTGAERNWMGGSEKTCGGDGCRGATDGTGSPKKPSLFISFYFLLFPSFLLLLFFLRYTHKNQRGSPCGHFFLFQTLRLLDSLSLSPLWFVRLPPPLPPPQQKYTSHRVLKIKKKWGKTMRNSSKSKRLEIAGSRVRLLPAKEIRFWGGIVNQTTSPPQKKLHFWLNRSIFMTWQVICLSVWHNKPVPFCVCLNSSPFVRVRQKRWVGVTRSFSVWFFFCIIESTSKVVWRNVDGPDLHQFTLLFVSINNTLPTIFYLHNGTCGNASDELIPFWADVIQNTRVKPFIYLLILVQPTNF